MKLSFNDYKDKVLGCWWGKTAGGTIGAPFECYRGVIDLNFYTQEDPSGVPNDDLDLQLAFLRVAEKYGNAIDSHILGEYWLNYISASMSEYGAGKNNLRNTIPPPLSATINNPNINSCGAFIRSELWACLNPAHPEDAIKYAYEDAIVDHSYEGVYGEIFCAAVQSAAFVENDLKILFDIGCHYIPKNCSVCKGVNAAIKAYDDKKSWKEARKIVLQTVPGSFGQMAGYYKGQSIEPDVPQGEHGFDAPSNVAIGVLGLLYGEKDFGKTLCITAGCMEDADCTAGFAGAVLGIILGASNLPSEWIDVLGHKIFTWCLRVDVDLHIPQSIEELTERVLRLTPRFINSKNIDNINCKNGYEIIYEADKLKHYKDIINYLVVPSFDKEYLQNIPNTVKYKNVLFDTYVTFFDGCQIAVGEKIKVGIKFWNNIFEHQWLQLKWRVDDGLKIMPNKVTSVNIDQMHGGYNVAYKEFEFELESAINGKVEGCLEIISNGRYTKTFIPLTILVK